MPTRLFSSLTHADHVNMVRMHIALLGLKAGLVRILGCYVEFVIFQMFHFKFIYQLFIVWKSTVLI